MKKKSISTLALAIVILFSGAALAGMDTGETYTDQTYLSARDVGIPGVQIYQIVWRAGVAGAFTETTLNSPAIGLILKAETIPSPFTCAVLDAVTTAKSWTQYSPTANYDILVTNTNDFDLFGGALANRSATAPEQTRALLAGTYGAIESYSRVTLKITGNSIAYAIGAIRLWILKR